MNDNEFWALVWKVVGLTIFGIVATMAGCTVHENYVLSEALKSGADPMSISCAKPSESTKVVCAIWATGRGEKK